MLKIRMFSREQESLGSPSVAGLCNSKVKESTPFFCKHIGPSMEPILRELDLLEILPYKDRPVRLGDVIMFAPPGGEQPVVHRVVSISSEGICTCGDNNDHVDPWHLKPRDILGKAVAVWRGQKKITVARGLTGQLEGALIRWRRTFLKKTSVLLGPAYRLLSEWNLFRRVLPNRLQPRVLIFQANGCNYFQLLIGRKVIGRYDANRRRWHIQRPFRLFVDTGSLPLNTSNFGKIE